MYHIFKTKSKVKPFGVVLLASTGEVLSQHALKTKQAAWKNVKAQAEAIGVNRLALQGVTISTHRLYVQDDTVKQPIKYLWDIFKRHKIRVTASPRYIPGKNPK